MFVTVMDHNTCAKVLFLGQSECTMKCIYYEVCLCVCVFIGARCGESMLEKLTAKIPVWQQEYGATVAVHENPFAVAIVTPIMSRAHGTAVSCDICFVDSTASCDADNHAITFLLTPTSAGAVPVGLIITDSASEASYTVAFQLLKNILPSTSFGGHGYQATFITDDSDAERNALQAVWPDAILRLCLFHVPQAVWRWLWSAAHSIAKEDRQILMAEFRQIMYSVTEQDAENAFVEALNSETASVYDNYQKYLETWWERKELWCLAWRSEHQRGHHTNNFAEVTVRLYKDVVLGRVKAYNAVSLVDFTVRVMEDYYRNRLRDFANGRISAQRLALEKLARKATYLRSCNQVDDYGENRYGVPNSNSTEKYDVDATLGCCSCMVGMFGKFCKHQLAIMNLFQTAFPNAPGVTTADRYNIAYIALGETCPPMDFYQNFQPVNVPANGVLNNSTECTAMAEVEALDQQSPADIPQNAEVECTVTPLLDEYCNLMQMHVSRFAEDKEVQSGLQKAVCTLRSISNAVSFATFLHSPGEVRRYRMGAAIRVQPTSLSRRRPSVTRGSKRLASGRPPVGTASKLKRRRCLSLNIRTNVPNAKSHGTGH